MIDTPAHNVLYAGDTLREIAQWCSWETRAALRQVCRNFHANLPKSDDTACATLMGRVTLRDILPERVTLRTHTRTLTPWQRHALTEIDLRQRRDNTDKRLKRFTAVVDLIVDGFPNVRILHIRGNTIGHVSEEARDHFEEIYCYEDFNTHDTMQLTEAYITHDRAVDLRCMPHLRTVYAPHAREVNATICDNLTSVYAYAAKTVSTWMNNNLTLIFAPSATEIDATYNENLVTIYSDTAEKIEAQECPNLMAVTAKKLKELDVTGCPNLTSVYLNLNTRVVGCSWLTNKNIEP